MTLPVSGGNRDSGQRELESWPRRLLRVLDEELGAIQPLLLLARALVAPLPRGRFPRLRRALYRACGLRIGARSLVYGALELGGGGDVRGRFSIGEECVIGSALWIDLSASVRIGDRVSIGADNVLITAGHDVGDPTRRGGFVVPEPITIEDDARLEASVTVLPGVTIGRGSVVSAGSLVVASVPAGKRVAGVPARALEDLPGPAPRVL